MTNNNLGLNMNNYAIVPVNKPTGSRYFMVEKNKASNFYKDMTKQEVNNNVVNTLTLIDSCFGGVYLVNKFSKKLSKFAQVAINIVGGIFASMITAPFANMYSTNSVNDIIKQYNAVELIMQDNQQPNR